MILDSILSLIPIQAAATTATAAAPELSVWDLCLKGGIIMIPLLLLSLVSIYIFVERWLVIRKAAVDDDTFMKRIKDYIHDGEIESAELLCKKTATPYARLIQKGISSKWLNSARDSHGLPPLRQALRCSDFSARSPVW